MSSPKNPTVAVHYVTAASRNEHTAWLLSERLAPGQQQPPQRHELAKFFTEQAARSYADSLHPAGWAEVRVEGRQELVSEQHEAHRGLFG